LSFNFIFNYNYNYNYNFHFIFYHEKTKPGSVSALGRVFFICNLLK